MPPAPRSWWHAEGVLVTVRHLRMIAIAMTVLGVGATLAALALGWGPLWTLTGMMLVVAGVVKIATVAIWNGVAGLGPIKTRDDPSHPPA